MWNAPGKCASFSGKGKRRINSEENELDRVFRTSALQFERSVSCAAQAAADHARSVAKEEILCERRHAQEAAEQFERRAHDKLKDEASVFAHSERAVADEGPREEEQLALESQQLQTEMLYMEERLRQQPSQAAAAVAKHELLHEQDASGKISSPHTTSHGSNVAPLQSGPEGVEDAHVAPPWITTADSAKSLELQQDLILREPELKDKEKEMETQRMELRYAPSQLRGVSGLVQAGSVPPHDSSHGGYPQEL